MSCFVEDIDEIKGEPSHVHWACAGNFALNSLINDFLANTQNLEEITASVLKNAKKLTGSAHGFVAEIDPISGDLIAHTLSSMFHGNCDLPFENKKIRFPKGKDNKYPTLWGYSLNTLTPFFTNSPHAHTASVGVPKGHVPIKNFLSIPVFLGAELVGQIALANCPEAFSDQHLKAVGQLAQLYALVLQRHRNFEQTGKLERQLRQAQKLEAVGTLAGGIAHDFNNILGIISGNAEILRDYPVIGEHGLNPLIEDMLDACLRAKDLISRILTFSRNADCEKRPVHLGFIVKDTIRLFRATMPKNIKIKFESIFSSDVVSGNSNQLSQVILNLCANAVQAMKEAGGTIHVSINELSISSFPDNSLERATFGKYLCLSVADAGPGIGAEVLERIFEPYFTTKSSSGGSGLGLAIVHGIVKGHGGEITVDSAPGKGASFNVFLPLAQSRVEDKIIKEHRLNSPCARILLVEDEAPLLRAMQRMLVSMGCDVAACCDGAEALDVFHAYKGRFDVVITDKSMPRMTGLRLIKKLISIRPEIPIILCTGFADEPAQEELIRLGVREIMFKPVTKKSLSEVLNKLLIVKEGFQGEIRDDEHPDNRRRPGLL